jgi:hypothetical protein
VDQVLLDKEMQAVLVQVVLNLTQVVEVVQVLLVQTDLQLLLV